MSQVLLRTLKRVTVLECNGEEFRDIVFDRLDLSVYEVESDEEVTQAHAEHAATYLERPMARGGIALLASDGGDLDAKVAGETLFEFTRTRHREIKFIDHDERERVASAVYLVREGRAQHRTADQLKAYARARLLARDQEWHSACEDKPKWKKCVNG